MRCLTRGRKSPFIGTVAYFGWLDGDDSQRKAMLEVVKLFEDSSTVDELGIGSVRDTFSNAFFPGTSTLHTRAKYFLFIAWLVNDVARHRWPVERSLTELRSREVKLIHALIAGAESQGVIGREAKSTLKSMPSELYWASLEHWGVRHWRSSLSGYFRNAAHHARAMEDPDADAVGADPLGMTSLPPYPATCSQPRPSSSTKPRRSTSRSGSLSLPVDRCSRGSRSTTPPLGRVGSGSTRPWTDSRTSFASSSSTPAVCT